MRKNKNLYLILFLGCISALAGFSISLAKQITDPIIENNKLASEKANLQYIFPSGEFKQIAYEQAGILGVYEVKKQGYIIKASATGYNSSVPIIVLIGIDKNNNVIGFYPLQQQETKGIGASCFEKKYIDEHYLNRDVASDIDALAGASRTSEAIKKIFKLTSTTLEKIKR